MASKGNEVLKLFEQAHTNTTGRHKVKISPTQVKNLNVSYTG